MREWRGEDNHEAEPSTASPERTNQLVASTYSAPKNLRKRWQKGHGDRGSEAAGRIRMRPGSTVTTSPTHGRKRFVFISYSASKIEKREKIDKQERSGLRLAD
jgi:hypothetical protein